MGRATAVLFALAWAAVAGSAPTDGEALFRENSGSVNSRQRPVPSNMR